MSRPSYTGPGKTCDARRRPGGQTLAEFGITISLLMVVLLGIFQVSYLIYQQYVAVNLAREGANLILRDTTNRSFDDTFSALRSAVADRQFAETRLILSVVQLGTDPGPNEGNPIIMNRHAWGMSTGASVLGDPPSDACYDAAADKNYAAKDPKTDRSIQAKLPNGLQLVANQSVYVAEIYRRRHDIVPFTGVPDSLYAVAFF
jgi:TadE-like protein